MTDVSFLSRLMTRRDDSLIDEQNADVFLRAKAAAGGARLLVIGAAGSIGSATVKLLKEFRPAALHLVDTDENGLADLVRTLRAGSGALPSDFRSTVASFGSEGFRQFVEMNGPYDVILNLAALKHVRSERDAFSLERMIRTNVIALEDLARLGACRRLFSVSSDKAVNPTNLMGATKRWMERVVADAGGTTTRFANVAFSQGSLLQAVLKRLDNREPIAAPSNISRYFITEREAATLCVLSAFECEPLQVLVPNLGMEHAISMTDAVAIILRHRGLEPRLCASEADAKALMAERPDDAPWWPCLFTPADTSGEKTLEELSYANEPVDARYGRIAAVRLTPSDRRVTAAARAAFEAACAKPRWEKADMVAAIRIAAPELAHIDLGTSLDDRI